MADIIEHLYSEQLKIAAMDIVRVIKNRGVILIDTPIMEGGESELHVDVKSNAQEVLSYFNGCKLIGTNWYKNPEHCNIILQVVK